MPRKRRIHREHILEAALNLMREEGFERFTARKIADHLKASTQPIYKEFTNMDDLKVNLTEYVIEMLGKEVFRLDDKGTGLKEACVNYTQFANEEQTLFSALFTHGELSIVTLQTFIEDSLHKAISRTEGLENLTESDRDSLLSIIWPTIFGVAVLTAQNVSTYEEESLSTRAENIVDHSVSVWKDFQKV